MRNLYILSAAVLVTATFTLGVINNDTDTTAMEDKSTKEQTPNNETTIISDNTLNNIEQQRQDALLANSTKLTEPQTSKMISSVEEGNFSDNVYNVREKIALGLSPERNELIAAMREVYRDRPASFRRNLEKSFDNVLNPKPYCNTMRENWARPYIAEVNNGLVFVNEDLWQKNSAGNKVQLSQYLSKCTQDGQALELISQDGGHTVAYYSMEEGYQSANL